MRFRHLLIAGALGAAVLPAQDSLTELVRTNMRALELGDSGLTGPGADFVLQEADAARFFLIGESHGNVETCRLTTWLLDELKGRGYGAYALETGPASTELYTRIARDKGAQGIFELTAEFPFSVAFLNWREEVEVFAHALDQGWAVWGLDQEFIGSGRFLLSRLIELAGDDAAKKLATEWHGKAMQGFAHFAKTGDQSMGFMATVTDADFDALDAAFADADHEATHILGELRASATVYGHYSARRYYMNNYDRIKLMKRHFVDRLQTTDDKVLMKFGSAHMGRGYSPFDQLDLGNIAAELAFADGSDSFHLQVFAKQSVQSDGTVKDFTASPELAPLYAEVPDTGGVLDLRALRPYCNSKRVKSDMPELCALVRRFDAILVLPSFTRSTEIVPMGR